VRSLIIAAVAALAFASAVPALAYQTGGSGHARTVHAAKCGRCVPTHSIARSGSGEHRHAGDGRAGGRVHGGWNVSTLGRPQ
jgi:hypothetical protein